MDPGRFVHFGPQHFGAVAAAVAGAVGLVAAVRAARSPRLAGAVRWTLALGCLGSEGFLLAWWALGRGWPLAWLLPLHLCDVALFLAPAVLLTGHRLLYELLYFWGLGGATQALLQPNLLTGFPALPCVCFFLAHGLLVASALFATLVMRLRPTGASVLRAWLLTNGYAALVFPINWALDTNYLFLMAKPPTPSVLDLMGPWPWYLLVLDAVALGLCGLCYLPFFVRDRWRNRVL